MVKKNKKPIGYRAGESMAKGVYKVFSIGKIKRGLKELKKVYAK